MARLLVQQPSRFDSCLLLERERVIWQQMLMAAWLSTPPNSYDEMRSRVTVQLLPSHMLSDAFAKPGRTSLPLYASSHGFGELRYMDLS